ncbi:DUF2339 domain-containing protein, partial [Candidatus Woesebacteria bacterium]|nr:DUF2339 domain-containing protein [Candidatus Woesebacteria bacterium]
MELLAIISIILSLYLFGKVSSLEKKVKVLLNDQLKGAATSSKDIQSPAPITVETKNAPSPAMNEEGNVDPISRFFKWYSHEWPLKTGAFFILLGFLWLVTYAFLNNWVGPVGRISFGMIVGMLILFFGEKKLRSVVAQGITLVGLGAGIIVLTTYAAQQVYDMFPPLVALGFIVIVMAFATFVSLKHRVLSLSIASLIIGGVAPLLIGSTENSLINLLLYLVGITVSTIWITRYSSWKILSTIVLVIIALHSVGIAASYGFNLLTAPTLVELFQLRFFAMTICSIIFFSIIGSIISSRKAETIDLFNAAFLGFVSLMWIASLTLEPYRGLVTIVVAVSYSLAAFIFAKKRDLPAAVQIFTVVSMTMLAVATSFEFGGPKLSVAFAVEALLLPIVAFKYLDKKTARYLLFYHFLSIMTSLQAFFGYEVFIPNTLFVMLVITLSTFGSGAYFYYSTRKDDTDFHSISLLLLFIGSIFGLATIWRMLHEFIPDTYMASMFSIVIFTLIGLSTYVIAEIHKRRVLYKFALGVLLFVIGHLLLIDIWDMALTMRIIT